MRRPRVGVSVLAVAVVLAGCAHGNRVQSGAGGSATDGGQRFETNASVEQVRGYGPRLCILPDDLVLYVVPHPCGGPSVKGWSWDAVAGETRSPKGVVDGTYHVVGTFTPGTVDDSTADAPSDPDQRGGLADGTFTLTEPAGAPDPRLGPPAGMPDFRSPCAVPPGGWVPTNTAKATAAAAQAANSYAIAQPDFGGLWLDHSPNPAFGHGETPVQGDDYTKVVLDVRFTGDLARHEAAIRDLWGGALCIGPATRRVSDLQALMMQVTKTMPGAVSGSVDQMTGRVDVRVIADNGALQTTMDRKYGPGLVVVTSDLHPVRS